VSRLVAVKAKEGSAPYEVPREEASSSSHMNLSVLVTFKEESGLTTGTCRVASSQESLRMREASVYHCVRQVANK
jgi:hypothetical protein